jgi:hypothetical protein
MKSSDFSRKSRFFFLCMLKTFFNI